MSKRIILLIRNMGSDPSPAVRCLLYDIPKFLGYGLLYKMVRLESIMYKVPSNSRMFCFHASVTWHENTGMMVGQWEAVRVELKKTFWKIRRIW